MSELVDIMKKILADSYALYLKTQNYHWNVTCKFSFRALHKLFEEQYEELAEAVDEIAERIRQLGSKAPASFSEYSKLTQINEGDVDNNAEQMLQDLIIDQKKLIDILNRGIQISYDAKDEGTADLLIDRLKVHDKNKWFLESSL